MSQIITKWIADGAITPSKLSNSSTFTMAGLNVTGDATIGNNLKINGDTSFVGNLVITNDTTVGKSLFITKNLRVGGDSTVVGNQSILGNFSAGNINITDATVGKLITDSLNGNPDLTCSANNLIMDASTHLIMDASTLFLNVLDTTYSGFGGNLLINAGNMEVQSDTTVRLGSNQAIYLNSPEIFFSTNQVFSFGDLNITGSGNVNLTLPDTTCTIISEYIDTQSDTTTRIGATQALYLTSPDIFVSSNLITSFGDLNFSVPTDSTYAVGGVFAVNAINGINMITGSGNALLSAIGSATLSSVFGPATISAGSGGVDIGSGAGVNIASATGMLLDTTGLMSLNADGTAAISAAGGASVTLDTDIFMTGTNASINVGGSLGLGGNAGVVMSSGAADTTVEAPGGFLDLEGSNIVIHSLGDTNLNSMTATVSAGEVQIGGSSLVRLSSASGDASILSNANLDIAANAVFLNAPNNIEIGTGNLILATGTGTLTSKFDSGTYVIESSNDPLKINVLAGKDMTMEAQGNIRLLTPGNIYLDPGSNLVINSSVGDTTNVVISGVTLHFTKGILTSVS